jgi:hypothetical protein
MNISVTNHAVDRYLERVESAKGFYRESVREQVRRIVEDGFTEGAVRPHPQDSNKRIIPFRSGPSILYLSIGPDTTGRGGDLSVISVLFEHEVTTGKVGIGLTLGDLFPQLELKAAPPQHPRYLLFIGPVATTAERYVFKDEEELRRIIDTRKPKVDEVAIYMLIE